MTQEHRKPDIMELIGAAPWREAVSYRESWPHEYVVVKDDGRQEPAPALRAAAVTTAPAAATTGCRRRAR